MGKQRIRVWFWTILAVALILRLGAAVVVQRIVAQTPNRVCLIAGDAEGYWELGRKIAEGKPYEIYDPPRRVLRMPGFPVVLAFSIRLFGDDIGAARMVLAVIGTLACATVYWLGRDLFSEPVGLIAAGLSAISPTFIVFSVMILSETAFALTLMLSVISLNWILRQFNSDTTALPRRALGTAFIAGLFAALACYMRPSWLLFPPTMTGLMWLFPPHRKTTVTALDPEKHQSHSRTLITGIGLALVFGLALGLAPWTIRNYFVTGGKIIPTTLWMGPSLYDGLNPEANGDSHMEFLPNSVYAEMTEYEVDRLYRNKAWSWAFANPGRVFWLGLIKLGRYWNLFPNTPQFDHWYVRLALLTFVLPILGFAAVGVVQTRVPDDRSSVGWGWMLVLTLGPILYFSALHTLFVSSLRYRLPAEYPLLILTGAGIFHCCFPGSNRRDDPHITK